MKPLPLYLLEVLFCSGLLLAFYHLMLVRRVAFVHCRRFLVMAILLSAALPLLNIPLYPARTRIVTATLVGEPAPIAAAERSPEVVSLQPTGGAAPKPAAAEPDPARTMRAVAWGLYGTVTALLLLALLRRMVAIRRLRRRARVTDRGDCFVAESDEVETPFSFWRTAYLGSGYDAEEREAVLAHEASHIRHRHSAELLVAELARCLLWFNPFLWLLQRALREVQEWEADRDVLDRGYDLNRYRQLLFRQLFGYNPDITCGLNHSFTQNRFVMMTRPETHRHALWRLGAAIPVVVGMMMLCSFTTRESSPAPDAPSAATSSESAPQRSEVRISDGKIYLNGREVTAGELRTAVIAWRDSLSREERPGMTVVIRAARTVPMGSVTDVKELLRKAAVLRVRYKTMEGETEVERLLPPRIEALPEGVEAVTPWERVPGNSQYSDSYRLRMAERNYFMVQVNARGTILAGTQGNLEQCGVEELKARAREFVLNPSHDSSLSESRQMEVDLPDGRTERYETSRGLFGIHLARETPYAAYAEVQQALSEVYAGLRTELSRRWFGRPFEELDEAQRIPVQRALPIRIFEADLHARNAQPDVAHLSDAH